MIQPVFHYAGGFWSESPKGWFREVNMVKLNTLVLWHNMNPFYVTHCYELTDNFRILSNITSGGTWKSNTKYWKEKTVMILLVSTLYLDTW